MALSLFFGRTNPGQIDELILDATINDTHDYTNEVTQYPREKDSDITDNIRRVPERVTITGFVTNTPIATLSFFNQGIVRSNADGSLQGKNLSAGANNDRVKTAYDTLLEISGRKAEGIDPDPRLVDIVTGLRVYRQMAMEKLTINRDKNNSRNHIVFIANFIKVETVVSQSVILPNLQESVQNLGASVTEKNKVTTTEATAAQNQKVSILKRGFRSLGAF